MKIQKPIQYFFKHYTTFPDRVFTILVMLGLVAGTGLILLNKLDFHFTTVTLLATQVSTMSWLNVACTIAFGSFFLFYGMYIQDKSPRFSIFLWGTGLFFWAVFINLIFANALQATPFTPIDHTLVKIDKQMGIDTPALMSWTHAHTHIHDILNFVYNSLAFEIILIPPLLAILNARKALGMFFIAQLFSFFIGGAIYYFFPTMAPSGVFHSPYFSAEQHDTSLRFYEVHHYLKVITDKGGLIAFPSFHVIWAILFTYAFRNTKIIFYPLSCYNLILIISTVLLGWHYFTDVIAGFILAFGAIAFGEWAYIT